MGISENKANCLEVHDLLVPKQECTSVTVEFDEESIADLTIKMLDAGYELQQFFRVWIHTHPGNSAHPSTVDEETFQSVFGGLNWSVMFILAKGGATYTRLRANVDGISVQQESACEVGWSLPFPASDLNAWENIYLASVKKKESYWGRTQVGYATGVYGTGLYSHRGTTGMVPQATTGAASAGKKSTVVSSGPAMQDISVARAGGATDRGLTDELDDLWSRDGYDNCVEMSDFFETVETEAGGVFAFEQQIEPSLERQVCAKCNCSGRQLLHLGCPEGQHCRFRSQVYSSLGVEYPTIRK